MNKSCYTNMEYHSAKKNKLLIYTTWMNLKIMLLSKRARLLHKIIWSNFYKTLKKYKLL